MIKVCHIASGDLWAGAEVQIATLLSELTKCPEVDIQAIILNDGRLARELRASGIKVKIFDENKYNSFTIFKKLLNIFETEAFDILHTHRYKENFLGGVAAKFRGIPYLVSTVHGQSEPFTGIKCIKTAAYSRLNDLMGKYFTNKIIAVSLDLQRSLRKRFNHGQVICIHNAIDMARIKVASSPEKMREGLQISKDHRIIGTIGRLVPIKGIQCLLKAAKIIIDKRSDVTLLIVGDGPLRNSLEQLSRSLHIEKHIRFLGTREDIFDLINIMDIVMFPSFHEGTPTAMLEALAMGKPVVATRVGGIPEIIRQDELGILIEPKKPEHLAEACLALLNNSMDTEDLKLKRKQYIAREFSSDVLRHKVIKLYKELVSQGN